MVWPTSLRIPLIVCYNFFSFRFLPFPAPVDGTDVLRTCRAWVAKQVLEHAFSYQSSSGSLPTWRKVISTL